MRQIKFRGKRIDTNEWIYGYPVKVVSSCGFGWNMHVPPADPDDYHKVYPIKEPIEQFTGLKDKNGVEIYEGDIVKITDYKPGLYVVFWDEHRVAWWGKNIKRGRRDKQYDDDFYQLLGDCFQVTSREVVGNIHDDPELLDS